MAANAPFQITQDIRDTFQAGIDAIIDQLGQDCRLVLKGEEAPCPNCRFDPVNRRSTGVYNGTGPAPFAGSPCPVCRGSGLDPATADVVLVRRFSVRRNLKAQEYYPPGTLTRPVTLARIKGVVDDYELVMQARHVVLDYKNAEVSGERYTRLSDPLFTGNIVSGRYFVCYLQREE